MRVLALDIGDVRIGIAAATTDLNVASPVCVLPKDEVLGLAKSFKRVLEDYEPDLLVIGRPLTLAGDEGVQAKHIEELAQQISAMLDIEYVFQDERLSSQEAKRILRAQGMTEKQMRGRIDSVAASLFLETWLKSRRD